MRKSSRPADQANRTHFRDWAIPGPAGPGGIATEEGETLDALCGRWWIFQKARGHRYSTDDVLCAWYASTWAPRVGRYCDLGSGIGSIAMMVAWRRPGCDVVTLEAQEASMALQRKSLRFNGIESRFKTLVGDLRDCSLLQDQPPFDLVTGAPPYWAENAAVAPQSDQAVGARLETRGTIADYAQTAAALLAPGGVFVCVFQASQDDKVRHALASADLSVVRTRPVRFKNGVPPQVSGAQVYLASRGEDLPPSMRERVVEEPPLDIRDEDGEVTPEYAAVKVAMGFPP